MTLMTLLAVKKRKKRRRRKETNPLNHVIKGSHVTHKSKMKIWIQIVGVSRFQTRGILSVYVCTSFHVLKIIITSKMCVHVL